MPHSNRKSCRTVHVHVLACAAAALLLGTVIALGGAQQAQAKDYTFAYGSGKDVVKVVGVKSGKVTYSKKTRTLTLNKATIKGGVRYFTRYRADGSTKKGKLTLKLVGKNKMTVTASALIGFQACGLFKNEGTGNKLSSYALALDALDLTVTGTGSLSTQCKRAKADKQSFAGLFHVNTLRLKGGTIKASGHSNTPVINCNRAVLSGAKVYLKKSGMKCTFGAKVTKGLLSIENCKETALETDTDISSKEGVAVSGGKIRIKGCDSEHAVFTELLDMSGGSISLKDVCRKYKKPTGGYRPLWSALYAGKGKLSGGKLSISGCKSCGLTVAGSLKVNGAKVAVDDVKHDGIIAGSKFVLSKGTVALSKIKGDGVEVSDSAFPQYVVTISTGTSKAKPEAEIPEPKGEGPLTVSGGTLSVSGSSGLGIRAKDMLLKKGSVAVSGFKLGGILVNSLVASGGAADVSACVACGLRVEENLTVSGGTVTVKNCKDGNLDIFAVSVGGKLEVTSGALTSNGNAVAGIQAGSTAVSGGSLTANENGGAGLSSGTIKLTGGSMTFKGNTQHCFTCTSAAFTGGTLTAKMGNGKTIEPSGSGNVELFAGTCTLKASCSYDIDDWLPWDARFEADGCMYRVVVYSPSDRGVVLQSGTSAARAVTFCNRTYAVE